MRIALLTTGVTAALCGCGSHNAATPDGAGGTIVSASNGQGGTITAHVSGDNATPAPSDLPKWAPVFPGAKVAQVMVQNDNEASVKSVVMTTSEDIKKVVTFYNAKIAAAGITPTMAQDTPDGAMRVVESAAGTKDVLMIGRSDDATSITLAYNIKR